MLCLNIIHHKTEKRIFLANKKNLRVTSFVSFSLRRTSSVSIWKSILHFRLLDSTTFETKWHHQPMAIWARAPEMFSERVTTSALSNWMSRPKHPQVRLLKCNLVQTYKYMYPIPIHIEYWTILKKIMVQLKGSAYTPRFL